MKHERLFNNKEIIKDISNIKLNKKIVENYYFLNNIKDEYKLKNADNAVINNMNLMI